MSANANAPIIIKRKKVVKGGGHHGGAWKVAYADFVTAMMAFFMLMWLLNATTEQQRKGIADYFSPTIPLMRISGGGDGSFGGDSVFTEETLAQNGTGATMKSASAGSAAEGSAGSGKDKAASDAEEKQLGQVEDALSAFSGESTVSDGFAKHIVTRVTDEGLIIELFDLAGDPLFHKGTNEPTQLVEDLVFMIGQVFGMVQNEVAINGFTRSHPIVLAQDPEWDLSSSRAHQIRELFASTDLAEERIQRVAGFADRKPSVANPMAPRNNRLEIILLRESR